jgi:hypothetical protein
MACAEVGYASERRRVDRGRAGMATLGSAIERVEILRQRLAGPAADFEH